MQDDPYFQNIAKPDEGPQQQHVAECNFLLEQGEAALVVPEKLIGIPNFVKWDTTENTLWIMLMDGSSVGVISPIPVEKRFTLQHLRRVRLASLWEGSTAENEQYIVHHVPFSVVGV